MATQDEKNSLSVLLDQFIIFLGTSLSINRCFLTVVYDASPNFHLLPPYTSLIFTFCELRNVVSFAIFGGPFTRLRRRVLAQEASFRFTLVRVPRSYETKGPSSSLGIKIGVFNAFDVLVDFANSIFNMELGWNMEELQIQGIKWSFYSNIAHIHKWNRLIQQDEVSW